MWWAIVTVAGITAMVVPACMKAYNTPECHEELYTQEDKPVINFEEDPRDAGLSSAAAHGDTL
jgi:hypothetical protein